MVYLVGIIDDWEHTMDEQAWHLLLVWDIGVRKCYERYLNGGPAIHATSEQRVPSRTGVTL